MTFALARNFAPRDPKNRDATEGRLLELMESWANCHNRGDGDLQRLGHRRMTDAEYQDMERKLEDIIFERWKLVSDPFPKAKIGYMAKDKRE
jgi:hypothetical protein